MGGTQRSWGEKDEHETVNEVDGVRSEVTDSSQRSGKQASAGITGPGTVRTRASMESLPLVDRQE